MNRKIMTMLILGVQDDLIRCPSKFVFVDFHDNNIGVKEHNLFEILFGSEGVLPTTEYKSLNALKIIQLSNNHHHFPNRALFISSLFLIPSPLSLVYGVPTCSMEFPVLVPTIPQEGQGLHNFI